MGIITWNSPPLPKKKPITEHDHRCAIPPTHICSLPPSCLQTLVYLEKLTWFLNLVELVSNYRSSSSTLATLTNVCWIIYLFWVHFWQMIYSSTFHQILHFLQEKHFWKKKIEIFNISENNMISVGLDWTGLDWPRRFEGVIFWMNILMQLTLASGCAATPKVGKTL